MPIASATPDTIKCAALELRAGSIVAFPTETVYGLGADATNARAVARIYAAKGRPHFNPLIVHVASLEAARSMVRLDDIAERLVTTFWPGGLTLVLPKATGCPVCDLVTAGLDTVAVRVPSNPVAQALLTAAGCPVAAPSANVSGRISATTAAHVAADFGDELFILDGGPTTAGLESTIIAPDRVKRDGGRPGAQSWHLLRPGALDRAAIETVIGAPLADPVKSNEFAPTSPGQLESHYAPRARLRLNVERPQDDEALLAFGPNAPAHAGFTVNLSHAGDLVEAAANLFAAMRELDRKGVQSIAAMPIPNNGLGEAINDRLRRAAAPR